MHHALKDDSKSFSTIAISGTDKGNYRKRMEIQMTPEMNWSYIDNDLVKPISLFVVFKDEEMRKTFSCVNTRGIVL